MNPGRGPCEKSTTGNGAELQQRCTDQRIGCRLGLKRIGLRIGVEREIRVKKRKLHQRPDGEATEFWQVNEEESEDSQMKGLYFFASFSKIRETYFSGS